MPCDLLPVLLSLSSGTVLEPAHGGRRERKRGLRLAELSCEFSGLFPVSEGHKLIQNFLQSLSRRPWSAAATPSLLCICVRFASDVGCLFTKFLDTFCH